MYSRSFTHPADQKPVQEELPDKPRRSSRSVKPRQRRAEPEPPSPPPAQKKASESTKKRRAAPEPPPPPPPSEEPRRKRRSLRRPASAPPAPLPEPIPAPQKSEGGGLMGLLKSVSTQDLLLIGLIFLLTMEQADDDILFILIALLFISSGE